MSRATKIRYLAKFRECGWVVELARGTTLNGSNLASIYGIPARRDTPYQSDTGGSVNVRRAPQNDTPLGITQSAHRSKTQQPTQVPRPSGVGVASNQRVGRWPQITPTDLGDDDLLLELHAFYAKCGIVPDSEHGLHIIFEAAENALANATSNAPGMFVRRIRDCKQHELFPVAEEVCDRANQRLKQARGYSSGEQRSGPSDNDAGVDQQHVDDAIRSETEKQSQIKVGEARVLLRGLSPEVFGTIREDVLSGLSKSNRAKYEDEDPLKHRGFTLAMAKCVSERVSIKSAE